MRVPEQTAWHINECICRWTEKDVARYAAAGPEAIDRRLDELDREWDIERLLEANAATFALIGVALGTFVDRRFYLLPGVVGAFLLQHAIQGWCPPVPVFRRLGVRTASEIDEERYALKALRGDFRDVATGDGHDPTRPGPETIVTGDPMFAIRPPKGYRTYPLQGRSVFVARGRRASPPRPDRIGSNLPVLIGRRGSGEAPIAPEPFARGYFRAREKTVGPMAFEAVERGRIGEVPFARVCWTAKHPMTGAWTRGFLYYATPGDLDIMIESQDDERRADETLPIAEAAVRTFRLVPR
jgi:hypothetical protein